jgi:hypothetical protein
MKHHLSITNSYGQFTNTTTIQDFNGLVSVDFWYSGLPQLSPETNIWIDGMTDWSDMCK